MNWRLGLVAIGLALATSASADSFPPRDECGDIPGADAFQMTLATAVANRDEAMLLPLFAPDVLLDFGGGSGRELLQERLNHPDYRLWDQLDELQRLGCGGDATGFYSPWYWGEDLGADDPFMTYLANGRAVPLRASPTEDAPILRLLEWDVVTLIDDEDDGSKFAEVAVGRMRGFVAWSDLRSQISYRMLVGRGDGQWRVTALVAGD